MEGVDSLNQLSLVIILLAALLIPLAMARFKITFLPTAVVEIIVGVILGPSLLNLIQINSTLDLLQNVGVIVLLFLSGMEIDFSLFKRRSTRLSPLEEKGKKQAPKYSVLTIAFLGYLSIIAMSIVMGVGLKLSGLFQDVFLSSILFMTISLGIVIASLKEKELLSRPFGQTILLIAALGEVVPMVGLTFYASAYSPNSKSLWLILLILVAAALLFLRFKPFFKLFDKINKSTTQLDVRLAFFMIVTLVTVAESVGAEGILGAFLAGIVIKLLEPHEETKVRLDSIGYGFFIPIFFMMSGVNLNLRQLISHSQTLLMIPAIFGAYIISKALVYFALKMRFKTSNAVAGTAMSATTITVVLAVLQVARHLHQINSQQSGAFLLAAILTCVIGPLMFNKGYSAETEDLKKTTVHFIGTNLTTVPVAQQLAKGWYDVTMYTNNQHNYRAFNSEVSIKLLDNMETGFMVNQGVFDADIVVMGQLNSKKNYELARAAKKYGVKRVIVRFEDRNILNDKQSELESLGVEVYNTPDVNISMLRSLIEAPSTMRLMTSTEASVYEVALRNSRYADIQVRNIPFIDKITITQIYRDKRFIRPTGGTSLKLNDRIIFTSSKQQAPEVRRELGKLN
ncbi:potassium transporter [Lentilactobacillus hilgardii]|uniref:Potassium transporter n=1 Tax=Lentilactobacillus hilgardii TaxID=1588 RepID=A0A6P1E554_LENHI|nr:TrkA C-terminal domain protein [Lentilactobacillus hilgardii ATCC 27305]MCT3390315.1 potassium transporter [Lentilactobacillus hilgardii]QHB51828.1 potassium transporter [Lentilactobacillus hilgardii]RRG07721.1 MAG: potassium transporter [Lactobacillus sp.]